MYILERICQKEKKNAVEREKNENWYRCAWWSQRNEVRTTRRGR